MPASWQSRCMACAQVMSKFRACAPDSPPWMTQARRPNHGRRSSGSSCGSTLRKRVVASVPTVSRSSIRPVVSAVVTVVPAQRFSGHVTSRSPSHAANSAIRPGRLVNQSHVWWRPWLLATLSMTTIRSQSNGTLVESASPMSLTNMNRGRPSSQGFLLRRSPVKPGSLAAFAMRSGQKVI